jgi:hypothetical protein
MDKFDLSQCSSSATTSLLNALFEDVCEDDETPSGPVKDEVDQYFKDKQGPECAIASHASLLLRSEIGD